MELLIYGNRIFDGLEKEPYAGYVGICGNRIVKTGKGSVPDGVLKEAKELIDAGDRLVMPGFHDNHVHLIMAGLYQKYANLLSARSEEECVELVKKATEELGETEGWVYGFSWYHVFWDKKELPTKESIDRYFPDRPVFLLNWEAHGAWVNSKALEVCGIDRDTPDPYGGRIERDANGEPTGILHEAAAGLATKHCMVFDRDKEKEMIRLFSEYANSYGITSITDVQPYFHGNIGDLETYSDMDKNGELTVRLHVAPDLLGDLDEVLEWRDKYKSDRLRVNYVKQFVDGVPTAHTGLLLDEYADDPGSTGEVLYDLDRIGRAVPEAHKRGLSVKLHSCGDGSLRYALNWYINAIDQYGENECRHCIEHCEMAHPDDIKKMGEYHIIPSVQPEAIAMTETFEENPYLTTLGEERAGKTWPFKSMLDATGVLAYGTDCPVMDPNPFYQIYRGVTRIHNDGMPEGGWNPTEKVTLYDSLRGYTWGSAYSVGRENEMGTLEEGKLADVAILSGDLFAAPCEAWKDMKVDYTIMDGNVVYKR